MAEMLDFEGFKRRYQEVPVEEYPNRVREAVPDPLLSVHLITYNHADYIRKAIESVLMQEVDFPMEIVLGDDDSSDGTREICVEYAKQYPELIRLQLHHRENNHSLYRRPTQLFQYWYNTLSARGKYIAVLSGDDYWTDCSKIKTQVSFLETKPEYSFTHHNAVVVDGKGKTKNSRYFPSKENKVYSSEKLIQAPLVVASSAVFRNVFDTVPPQFMSTIHEDRLVTSWLGKWGKGKYLNSKMSAYRKCGEGLYDSSDRKIRYLDKKRYLEVVSKVMCESKKCSEKVESQRIELSKLEYMKLVRHGKYKLALKSIVPLFVSLLALGRPQKAVKWIVTSCRFLFGDIKRSIFLGMSIS